MKRIQESQFKPHPAYYFLHHGVLKEYSLTTKFRVVFDGSSRSTSEFLLNDLFHTGEKITNLII